MQANRRVFVAGALAACVVVIRPRAAANGAATGTRRFGLIRGGTRHRSTERDCLARRSQVTVEADVNISVRIVGVPVYRYALSSSEVWDGWKADGTRRRYRRQRVT